MTEDCDSSDVVPESVGEEVLTPELIEGAEELESALLAATEELEYELAKNKAELEESAEPQPVPAEASTSDPNMEMPLEPRHPRHAGSGKMHADFIKDIPTNFQLADAKKTTKADGPTIEDVDSGHKLSKERLSFRFENKPRDEKIGFEHNTDDDSGFSGAYGKPEPHLSMVPPASEEWGNVSADGMSLRKYIMAPLKMHTDDCGELSDTQKDAGVDSVGAEYFARNEKFFDFAEPELQKNKDTFLPFQKTTVMQPNIMQDKDTTHKPPRQQEPKQRETPREVQQSLKKPEKPEVQKYGDTFSDLRKTTAVQPNIMQDKDTAPKPPRQQESKQRETPREVQQSLKKPEKPEVQKYRDTFSALRKTTVVQSNIMQGKDTVPKPPQQQKPRQKRDMLGGDMSRMRTPATRGNPAVEWLRQMTLKEKNVPASSLSMDFDGKEKLDNLMEMNWEKRGKRSQKSDFRICL